MNISNETIFQFFNQQKTAEDIVRVNLNEVSYCAIMKWLPVVELDFGQERVLIEDPNESYRNGRFHRVPVIAGITTDEYADPVPSTFKLYAFSLFQF